MTASQREQIGGVHLMLSDPGFALVDNRFARIRSMDAATIRQSAAQELGCTDAVYGFHPYGSSGEQESERGIFAFMPTNVLRDYISSLDTLATKLVEVLPSAFVELAQTADHPFIAITVRATCTNVMLGDPESGALTSRTLPVGVQSFTKALAEAMSMPIRQAAEGLARRNCIPSLQEATGPVPLTATERALRPIVEAFKTELLSSLEYMRFQRLGEVPDVLLISGDVDCIRGLRAWLTELISLTTMDGADLHSLFSDGIKLPRANLLEGTGKGLLKVGRVEYRFENGRFAADQPISRRPSITQAALTPRLPKAPQWDQWLPEAGLRQLSAPVAMVLATAAVIYTLVAGGAAAQQDGLTTLSSAMAEDAALRGTIMRRLEADQTREPEPLFLTDKLTAIAHALPDSIWLNRVTTSSEGPAGPRDNRLTIEGSVGLGSADYLSRVNAFIERLSADPSFMASVTNIVLSNASAVQGQPGTSASFTLSIGLKPAVAGPAGRT